MNPVPYSTGDRIKAWIQASRPPFFIATFIPLFIGWILGARQGETHAVRFVLILLGCFFVHFATNLANDYFDHLAGADEGESIGGSRVLQQGKITLRSIRNALFLLYGAAAAIALGLMVRFDLWAIAPLVLFALFSSIFYVAPPVRYGYHGLGELFAGINMGPIMVVGTYWVISGNPDWEPFFISLPVGLMVASILYYQNLPDMETDQGVGKRTLAVRLGKQGALYGFIAIWILIYGGILFLNLFGFLSSISLFFIATIPIFLRLLKIMGKTQDWVELDSYGKFVRILYLLNGVFMILSLI